jgi:small GTP-binding protein
MNKPLLDNRRGIIDTVNFIQLKYALLQKSGEENKILEILSRMEAKVNTRVVLLKEGKSRLSSRNPEASAPDYWQTSLSIIRQVRLAFLESKESFSQLLSSLMIEATKPKKSPLVEYVEQGTIRDVIQGRKDILTGNAKLETKGGKICILGLDRAGKTTILQRMKTGQFITNHTTTIGVNTETIQIDKEKFTLWDLGGHAIFRRALWEMYMRFSVGLIFVVDSYDQHRFPEVKSSLLRVSNIPQLKGIPLALFFNKIDLIPNFPNQNLSNLLGVDEIQDRKLGIFQTSAKTGEGITEGMHWLINAIRK